MDKLEKIGYMAPPPFDDGHDKQLRVNDELEGNALKGEALEVCSEETDLFEIDLFEEIFEEINDEEQLFCECFLVSTLEAKKIVQSAVQELVQSAQLAESINWQDLKKYCKGQEHFGHGCGQCLKQIEQLISST